jgi:hypothetical protein
MIPLPLRLSRPAAQPRARDPAPRRTFAEDGTEVPWARFCRQRLARLCARRVDTGIEPFGVYSAVPPESEAIVVGC